MSLLSPTRTPLLNGEGFHSALEAKVVIEEWVVIYNTTRPHGSLRMWTPERFAADWHAANPMPRRRPRQAKSSTASPKRGS